MHTMTRRDALSAAIAAVGVPSSGIATTGGSSLSAPIESSIDRLFEVKQPAPGYALGIIKDGALILAKGYGFANLEDRVPIGPGTAFHIASLSKQFTGAAVALCILDQKLTLDDPVSRYFPAIGGFTKDLRVKHLVFMTSGLPEYTSLKRASGEPWFSPYRFTTAEAIATVIAAARTEFEPGASWAYRNINYMLLAEIVARVQETTFAAFVKRRIFTPLGMSASVVDDDALQLIARRAIGFAPRTANTVRDLQSVQVGVSEGSDWLRMNRNSPHYGGSGVFTTIENWLKWDSNWTSHQLAGEAFTQLMHSRMRFAHPKENDAFGLVFGEHGGRRTIWFSGADLDASSYAVRFPGQRLTICCLSNNPAGEAEQRVRALLDILTASGVY